MPTPLERQLSMKASSSMSLQTRRLNSSTNVQERRSVRNRSGSGAMSYKPVPETPKQPIRKGRTQDNSQRLTFIDSDDEEKEESGADDKSSQGEEVQEPPTPVLEKKDSITPRDLEDLEVGQVIHVDDAGHLKTYRTKLKSGLVKMEILRAEGLRPCNAGRYRSPYVSVFCDDGAHEAFKTAPREKTLDPAWESGAYFEKTVAAGSSLVIEVWDSVATKDDFLGEVRFVNVDDFANHPWIDTGFKLDAGDMRRMFITATGSLYLRITFVPQEKTLVREMNKAQVEACILAAPKKYFPRHPDKGKLKRQNLSVGPLKGPMRHEKFAAVLIQARWRGILTRKHYERDLQEQQEAAVTIQKHLRGYLARQGKELLTPFQKDQIEKEERDKIHRAATKIQARVRGIIARRLVFEEIFNSFNNTKGPEDGSEANGTKPAKGEHKVKLKEDPYSHRTDLNASFIASMRRADAENLGQEYHPSVPANKLPYTESLPVPAAFKRNRHFMWSSARTKVRPPSEPIEFLISNKRTRREQQERRERRRTAPEEYEALEWTRGPRKKSEDDQVPEVANRGAPRYMGPKVEPLKRVPRTKAGRRDTISEAKAAPLSPMVSGTLRRLDFATDEERAFVDEMKEMIEFNEAALQLPQHLRHRAYGGRHSIIAMEEALITMQLDNNKGVPESPKSPGPPLRSGKTEKPQNESTRKSKGHAQLSITLPEIGARNKKNGKVVVSPIVPSPKVLYDAEKMHERVGTGSRPKRQEWTTNFTISPEKTRRVPPLLLEKKVHGEDIFANKTARDRTQTGEWEARKEFGASKPQPSSARRYRDMRKQYGTQNRTTERAAILQDPGSPNSADDIEPEDVDLMPAHVFVEALNSAKSRNADYQPPRKPQTWRSLKGTL